MTTSTRNVDNPTPLAQLARGAFAVLAGLYAAGVAAQVFAVGMVLLGGQGLWLEHHRTLGHALGALVVALPVVGLLGRLPRAALLGAALLFVLHGLQYTFVYSGEAAFVRALHALNALALFWLARSLARPARWGGLLRPRGAPTGVSTEPG